MWFKMGIEILNSAFMRDLRRPKCAHDSGFVHRQLGLIYLLSITATGAANDLQDATDLARLVDTTPKQAQIVWDILIKHGVLRKGPQGYSARPWMIERGILGDFNKRRRQDEQRGQHEQQPQMPFGLGDGGKTQW